MTQPGEQDVLSMKQFITLGMAIYLALLIFGFSNAEAFNDRNGRECARFKPEWDVCETDEDCTVVQGYCRKHAVNRAYAEEAYELY